MEVVLEARKLANFIKNLESFETLYVEEEFCYHHIGALFIDVILQAGLNYNTIVKPRVQSFLLKYPDVDTTLKFQTLIEKHGLEKIMNWKNEKKINRLKDLVAFALDRKINTCVDFKIFLLNRTNQKELLMLNGIGPKTIDYTLKLLNFDTVAVDRHIYSFVMMAEINVKNYVFTKKVVEYAADFLQIPRASIDYSIWKYMSDKDKFNFYNNSQMEFQF